MKKNSSFDIVFDGFSFASGILAFSSLKAGLKVGIKSAGKFTLNFEPEISGYYPRSVSQILTSVRNYSLLRSCSSLFPHLFMPQRLLWLSTSETIKPNFYLVADKLLNLDRESTSLPIKISKYKAYQPLEKLFSNGVLVFEYRFDRQRAIIELFQLCLKLGAVHLHEEEKEISKIHIQGLPSVFNEHSFTIHNFTFIPGNNVRISTLYFDLTFQTVLTDTKLNLLFKGKLNRFEFVKKEFSDLVENLNLPASAEMENWFQNVFHLYHSGSYPLALKDPDLNSLRKTIISWEKKISRQTGNRINLKNAVTDYLSEEMTYEHFRKIQNECDEKFDEAKQSGISYSLFMYMFYRYRPTIDQLINRAYEIVDQEKNAEIAWRKTEKEFFDKNWLGQKGKANIVLLLAIDKTNNH